MKKIMLILVLFSFPSFGGMPVVDESNLTQNILSYTATSAEFIEQASRWQQTLTQYTNQLNVLRSQVESQTGIRDVKKLVSDYKSINKNLSNFKSLTLSDIESKGGDVLDSQSKKLLDTNILYNRCTQSDIKIKSLCQSSQYSYATAQAQIAVATEELKKLADEFSDLQIEAQASTDVKKSQDINNMAQTKLAQLEIVKSKMEIAKTNYDIANRIREEQERELESQQNRNLDIYPGLIKGKGE